MPWNILILIGTALTAGVFTLIAVYVGASLTARYTAENTHENWKKQRRFDLQYQVFQGAVRALAAYYSDAIDPVVQRRNEGLPNKRYAEMQPQTAAGLQEYRGLVETFFTRPVFEKYEAVKQADIAIEKVPCLDFDQKRLAFIVAAAASSIALNKAR